MYVLNEEDYIRGILASKSKPSDLGMGYLITLIAKYYYSEEYDVADVVEIVKMKLREMNIPLYQEYKYHPKIQNICSALYDGKISKDFRKREYIPIYKEASPFSDWISRSVRFNGSPLSDGEKGRRRKQKSFLAAPCVWGTYL